MMFKSVLFSFLVVMVGSSVALANSESKDQLSMIYLGKGTRLVLKKDLEIPANAGRLRFSYPMPNKYQDGCLLELRPSTEDRRMSAGREIVLSGKVLKHAETFISIEVERPQDITGITCTDAWDGQVSIAKFKSAFSEQAEVVFPEPSELPE